MTIIGQPPVLAVFLQLPKDIYNSKILYIYLKANKNIPAVKLAKSTGVHNKTY